MLPTRLRKAVEEQLIKYHIRKCDSLEEKADAYDTIGEYYNAALKYEQAAKHAHIIKDTQREIRVLIRSSDSLEEYANQMMDEGTLGDIEEQYSHGVTAFNALRAASYKVQQVRKLGEEHFVKKEKRLDKRASVILDALRRF